MNKDIRHLDLNTPDGAQLNMDALYQIAPSAFTIAGTPFVVSQNADIILLRGYNMEIEISRSLWERGRPARGLCAAPRPQGKPAHKGNFSSPPKLGGVPHRGEEVCPPQPKKIIDNISKK